MSNIKVSSDIDTFLRKSTKEEAATFLGLEDTKAVWGQITGTLSNQTDLVSALALKGSASQQVTNTTNIATNTANISSNDTDISTNTASIATNTASIATNATNIATNVTDIATNVTDIATNATNIATNVTNIATNATNIATNVTSIAGKQDTLTFGIANTNAVKIDNTSAAANGGDICRFASTGIMPYKYADLKYDLGVDLKAPIDSPAFTGSAKVGTNNVVSSSINSLAVGNQNTINGNFSLVVGILNTTHRSGNYALGDRNEVGHPTLGIGGNSTAIGSDNILKGGNSFIAGNDNSLTEVQTGVVSSSIIGNNNDISGSQRVFIVGTSNNIIDSDDAVAVGQNAVITGDNSIVVGNGLRDFADNDTVIFGRFNDNPRAASKIVIGAGFSDTARYNAIEIESKGPLQKARSKMIFKSLFDTNSYADDSAASSAGVEVGELYRTDSVVKIRMS